MEDKEKIEQLRKTLAPVISWYKQAQQDSELDSSYIYDTTAERFDDLLTRSDFQRIIEILL